MSDIATGLWFDNSQSAAIGWTITLPIDKGNLLLSALTFLVTIAGTCAWSIVASLVHSHIVRRRSVAQIFDLQQQVALRNSSGALGTLWDTYRIHRAWAKVRLRKIWGRTLSVALPALVVSIGFAAASILTARVATKGYGTVLARSAENNCGNYLFPANATVDEADAVAGKLINDTNQARTYASSYYGNGSTIGPSRSVFAVPYLPITIDTSAACPVANQSRCTQGHNTAIQMQTSQLDSHSMLGINAKPADRVTVQLITTCAMIDVSGYADIVNGSALQFDLGPAHGANFTYLYYPNVYRELIGYQIWYARS
jgi:hypothetical protein